MSQSDFSIGNISAPSFRIELNDSLQALASLNSGDDEPEATYANMLWYDTALHILKMRSEADDAWINVAYVDQSDNAWLVLDDTQVVDTSGVQTGLLGDQSTATWEAGTGTTESLVSPAKVKAAVKPALNASGNAPIYACRAWVNFNGTGTVSIRASGNVSSITDNGTGNYTVNFATAMPDANYSVNVTASAIPAISTGVIGTLNGSSLPASGSVAVTTISDNAIFRDPAVVTVSVFR
jgi:hypothetical protein